MLEVCNTIHKSLNVNTCSVFLQKCLVDDLKDVVFFRPFKYGT